MFNYAFSFRKSENQSNEAGVSGEAVQDPRVVVQSSVESDMTGDGFRWRKYGQKVVKGNPYPRLERFFYCLVNACRPLKTIF